ncbi:ankyrin repeat-containing protein [Anaeramoeba flamelloides]|uniref:Ankyrin repeat-containing protein n=1 Tax=Anaeramoeba flamelloides TaxID=1746091 RepID=A0ABQ8ZEE6_9EUKA|nr:ankyrin repeat-containing protein [Anaeramoeba flamelloides]
MNQLKQESSQLGLHYFCSLGRSRDLIDQCLLYRNCINNQDMNGDTPLHHFIRSSCENDLVEGIKILILSGSDLKMQNKYQRNALFELFLRKSQNVKIIDFHKLVELFQKFGSELFVTDVDNQNSFILYCQPESIQLESLKMFLKLGLDPNKLNDNNETPFIKYLQKVIINDFDAESNNFIEAFKYFFKYGANPMLKDRKGNTALHTIFEKYGFDPMFNHEIFCDILDLFLKNGADPLSLNRNERTPYEILLQKAFSKRDPKILDYIEILLENRGFDINWTDNYNNNTLHYFFQYYVHQNMNGKSKKNNNENENENENDDNDNDGLNILGSLIKHDLNLNLQSKEHGYILEMILSQNMNMELYYYFHMLIRNEVMLNIVCQDGHYLLQLLFEKEQNSQNPKEKKNLKKIILKIISSQEDLGLNTNLLAKYFWTCCENQIKKIGPWIKAFRFYKIDFNYYDPEEKTTSLHRLCKNPKLYLSDIINLANYQPLSLTKKNHLEETAFHIFCTNLSVPFNKQMVQNCQQFSQISHFKDKNGKEAMERYLNKQVNLTLTECKVILHSSLFSKTNIQIYQKLIFLICTQPDLDSIFRVIEELTYKYLNKKFNFRDSFGDTILHKLVMNKAIYQNIEQFLKFLDLDASLLNTPNHNNQTPCHLIFSHCPEQFIHHILQRKPNLGILDFNSETPPSLLVRNKNTLSSNLLVELFRKGIDPNLKIPEHGTLFHFFITLKPKISYIFQILVTKFNSLSVKNNKNQNVLHLLHNLNRGLMKILEIWIQKGGKLNETDQEGNTFLHLLCKDPERNLPIIKFLIMCFRNRNYYHRINHNKNEEKEKQNIINLKQNNNYNTNGNNWNLNLANNQSQTPLHIICCSNFKDHLQIIKLFAENGANFLVQDKKNKTPIDYFYERNPFNNIELIKYFLKHGIHPKDIYFGKKNLWHHLFHRSIPNSNLLLDYLLTLNFDLNLVDKKKKNPLHYLGKLEKVEPEMLKRLLDLKCNLNQKSLKNKSPMNSLIVNCVLNVEILNLIIKYGGDVNTKFRIKKNSKSRIAKSTYLITYCLKNNFDVEIIHRILQSGAYVKQEVTGKDECGLIFRKYDYERFILEKFTLDYQQKFSNDFEKFYESGLFADFTIKEQKAHKFLLELRTGKKIQDIKNVLQNYSKEEIKIFFKWIYSDKVEDKQVVEEINFLLDIENYKIKKLVRDLTKLYLERSISHDLVLISKENNKIYVHKFILMARSKLFRELFDCIDSNQKTLKLQKSYDPKTLQILIKYFYLGIIDPNDMEKNYEGIPNLLDAMEYFQMDKETNSQYILDNFCTQVIL